MEGGTTTWVDMKNKVAPWVAWVDAPAAKRPSQGLSQGGKGGKFSTCKRAVSTRDLPDAPGFHLSSHADHWPQAQCGS